MPDYTSALKDDQVNSKITRNAAPSHRTLQQKLNYAFLPYTFAGTEADTETITLGSLGVKDATVIPELSRIRDTGGAEDIDVDLKLNALVGGATSTDLSGTVSLDNNTVALTGIAASALVELGQTDDLRLIVDDASIGAVTAGETIVVEVAYVSPNVV